MHGKSDNEPAQIIWVFGNSAVGKQTFIEECIAGNEIIKKLGWDSKKIGFSPTSMKILGHDEQVERREDIISECRNVLVDGGIVLIKWQYEDSETGRISRLKQAFPNSEQKIIWVIAPSYEVQRVRLVQKPWWSDGDARQKEFIETENSEVANFVKLAEEIVGQSTTVITSLEGRQYELR